MDVKAVEKIIHSGVSYEAGEIIPGLSEVEGKRLITLGAAVAIEGFVPAPDGNKDDDMNPKEFASSLAEKQKEVLESIGIFPASNAEERVNQYTEWYNDVDPE